MEKKIKLTVRQASAEDHHLVTQLRVDGYRSSGEFKVLNPEFLAIQRGSVYLIETEGKIIASLQQENISSCELFTGLTNTQIPHDFKYFETIYHSKGVTDASYRNMGLNSLLRFHSLSKYAQHQNINSFASIVYEKAPRLNTLKDMGYKFKQTQLISSKYTSPSGKIYFTYLERSHFKKALKKLDSHLSSLHKKYHVDFIG